MSDVLTPAEARKENREEHQKFDARLHRLELSLLALSLIVIGNGAGAVLAKVVGG